MSFFKGRKHILLDEMQQATGLHRKSTIYLMNDPFLTTERRPRTRERSPVYGAILKDSFRIVAKALDYPAAERLKLALLSTATSQASENLNLQSS